MLVLMTKGTGQTMWTAAPNRDQELKNLSSSKSELAACWADISLAVRGAPKFVKMLIAICANRSYLEVWPALFWDKK